MNKKSKVAVAGVAAVALVGGTLAYWNQTTTINNPFSTNSYGGETVEEFNPAEGGDWEPGATVDKKVSVTNTGDYPIYVRVQFTEEWTNLKSDVATKTNNAAITAADVNQISATDGLVKADGSVVQKNLIENWKDNWIYDNGWYYYKTALEVDENNTTGNLLESVTLDQATDMGVYEEYVTVSVEKADGTKKEFKGTDVKVETTEVDGTTTVTVKKVKEGEADEILYTTTDKNDKIVQSVKKQLASGKGGYADADYVLTIKTEMCQEDENGTPAEWKTPTTTTTTEPTE